MMFKFYKWLLDVVVSAFLSYIMNTKNVCIEDMQSQEEYDDYCNRATYASLLKLIADSQILIDFPVDSKEYEFCDETLAVTADDFHAECKKEEEE